MRRSLLFMMLAGVAALVAALVVYSALKKREQEVQMAMAQSVNIVVAAHDLHIGTQLDPTAVTAGDLISREVVVVREDQGVFETIEHMRAHGVRRMPVVDQQGALVGILAIDDLIELLAEELSKLPKLVSREQAQEAETKRSHVLGAAPLGKSAAR